MEKETVAKSKNLRQYFPIIREREEIRQEIREYPHLQEIFKKWSKKQQEKFLNFCSGTKGVKMLYDAFFKEIMNPEYAPERLNELLSLFLGKKVTIIEVLPNDSTRIADESSLLIMDIVVQLEDGSVANVEVQKIGYHFPGERAACYSADLLLRQYKRVRGEKSKTFSYKDIKTVYTIVLFEKSSREFHAFPEKYMHTFKQVSNTGIELDLLQQYLFIPLDIFRDIQHNKGIRNKTDAWLTFLCIDEPEEIIKLIEGYPEFGEMYEEVYQMCLNTEKVMNMFSKELAELDKNTVQYMIDEMQDEIDEKSSRIDEMQDEIDEKSSRIDEMQNQLEQKVNMIAELEEKIKELEEK